MKANKISPGPWTAELTEIHGYSFYTIVSKTEIIAPVQRDQSAGGVHNANLLAAAPDLLSALKSLVKEELAFQDSKKYGAVCTRKLKKAHKAIAKAEGKT